ncbi:hypothetical protein BH10BAC3_BH10BAC3_36070 [soil metagenome]
MEAVTKERKKRSGRVIPTYLICEELNGQPLYYKGYKQVLSGKKNKEEIMGASGLQIILIAYMVDLLNSNINKKAFWVLSGEAGLHIGFRNNVSSDVCVYEKSKLTPDKITSNYLDIPPKLVVEVDISVELETMTFSDYILSKTKNLLDFGTEKVVWIFTRSKKVFIAEPGKDWYFTDWNNTVLLIEGIHFNVAEYLASEGIEVNESL